MSEDITFLRERLRKFLGNTPAEEVNAKDLLRGNIAHAFEEAGFQVDQKIIEKYTNLSHDEFDEFFKNFKDIARYEELKPSEQRDLLKRLAPFFRDFLFIEDEPGDEDRPKY